MLNATVPISGVRSISEVNHILWLGYETSAVESISKAEIGKNWSTEDLE